ncbi:hypothetical protein RHSIM_Rhsim13G0069500 [Rhododendron simsii]|uniref:Carbohydrate kinase PfkB domain-containing protein n=1 Tax=Rhododendron simsii TaxID=118357 RepID=A0A834G135_RHOSS|nr:hypothetical protein RHSIM_Rhsim13G0069500 [Rhododendron simsii]
MVRKNPQHHPQPPSHCTLIVGNYCHDVLFKDNTVIAQTLGGASSFISAVFDPLSSEPSSTSYISKVGPDFSHHVSHPPILSPSSPTTLFHAHFSSEPRRQDRVLKRVRSCDPILPSDFPTNAKFNFGLAAAVAGEILPETLARMLDICDTLFVDVQGLIRAFDPVDGTVSLIGLKISGFHHLLPRIRFLKASAEEAPFVDVEEARRLCCVVVTNGEDGCTVYWNDGEYRIAPFPTVQVDPTGAGDSFLGGFVAGLVHGLAVPDAALLGNFCGSLTVGHVGLPKFDSKLLQVFFYLGCNIILRHIVLGYPLVHANESWRVKDEVVKREMQYSCCLDGQDDGLKFEKPLGHDQFHASLAAAKLATGCSIRECQQD